MPDDVIVNKAEIIEKHLKRVKAIYQGNPANLQVDQIPYDAILFNLEKACQATIDLAMRWVRIRALGVPKESRDAFSLLEAEKLVEPELAASLRRMVGFRNIAVHGYQALDPVIIRRIIESDFQEIRSFIRLALAAPGI